MLVQIAAVGGNQRGRTFFKQHGWTELGSDKIEQKVIAHLYHNTLNLLHGDRHSQGNIRPCWCKDFQICTSKDFQILTDELQQLAVDFSERSASTLSLFAKLTAFLLHAVHIQSSPAL